MWARIGCQWSLSFPVRVIVISTFASRGQKWIVCFSLQTNYLRYTTVCCYVLWLKLYDFPWSVPDQLPVTCTFALTIPLHQLFEKNCRIARHVSFRQCIRLQQQRLVLLILKGGANQTLCDYHRRGMARFDCSLQQLCSFCSELFICECSAGSEHAVNGQRLICRLWSRRIDPLTSQSPTFPTRVLQTCAQTTEPHLPRPSPFAARRHARNFLYMKAQSWFGLTKKVKGLTFGTQSKAWEGAEQVGGFTSVDYVGIRNDTGRVPDHRTYDAALSWSLYHFRPNPTQTI